MNKYFLLITTFFISVATLSNIQNLLKSHNETINDRFWHHNIKNKNMQGHDDNNVNFNAATVAPFGPKLKLYRKIRLNVFMMGDMYAYFLEMMKTSPTNFAQRFIGPVEPYLHAEWTKAQNEMSDGFKSASITHNESLNYFGDVFKKWLTDPITWKDFEDVFTGANLQNNTYQMTDKYNQAQAQEDFRKKGAILQFNLIPIDNTEKKWKVSKFVKIFPYIPEVNALKQYYQNYAVSRGHLIKAPPVMEIDIGTVPIARYTVFALFAFIVKTLSFNFSVPQSLITSPTKQIEIPESEFHEFISIYAQRPTPLRINFYSQAINPVFYIKKTIELYVVNS